MILILAQEEEVIILIAQLVVLSIHTLQLPQIPIQLIPHITHPIKWILIYKKYIEYENLIFCPISRMNKMIHKFIRKDRYLAIVKKFDLKSKIEPFELHKDILIHWKTFLWVFECYFSKILTRKDILFFVSE